MTKRDRSEDNVTDGVWDLLLEDPAVYSLMQSMERTRLTGR